MNGKSDNNALDKKGTAVTGRARLRWGATAAYQSITPQSVRWPGDRRHNDTQTVSGQYATLRNTAVHAKPGDRNRDPAPAVRYQRPGSPRKQTSERVPTPQKRRVHSGFSRWTVIALGIATIVCLPIVAVLWLAFNPSENIWPHLLSTVLPDYILNTLGLMMGVAVGTLLIGIGAAWLVTHYEFPGRTLFNWCLLLPFAVPAYVIAYVYTDLLEFAGPVQGTLRTLFGWKLASDYWFPEIRTLPGAIIMMVLVLYPYVYLLARAAFLEQSASVLEAAHALGVRSFRRFYKVALPMARPAIVVGLAMALMETLNDFGTVDYFAVRTLTAGLYDVWLGMNNLGGGAQIASLLLMFVLILITLERISRQHQKHYQPGASRFRQQIRTPLRGMTAALATLACAMPVFLGFVVPAVVLLQYAITYFDKSFTKDFQTIAWHSITLSAGAALVTIILGLLLSYSARLHSSRLLRFCVSTSSLGYAVPGAVLAIGVIIPFAAFDNTLDGLMREAFGISTGLLLSGTVFALVFAYAVRFLAVAFGSIDASMKKISPHMDDAARSLGQSSFNILTRIHLPLMKGGVLTAALVVFVDCMKELPATLILRPFNFDTLATHVYQFASDELIGEAALGALLIVVVGLAPVLLLTRSIDRSRELRRLPGNARPVTLQPEGNPNNHSATLPG